MDVLMPQLGETVAEGKITKWFVAPGAAVKPGDNLFEIETDKVSMEVPAPMAGYITQILVPAGTTVAVGTVLAVVESTASATAPAPAPAAKPAAPPPAPLTATAAAPAAVAAAPVAKLAATQRSDHVRLSPAVRRLAAEYRLDLAAVNGSGRNGRITRRNVLEFIRKQQDAPAAVAPAAPAPAAAAAPAARAPAPAPAAQPPAGAKTVPFTRIRKLTAEHMVRSKATSPHVLQAVEVDFFRVDQVRKSVRDAWKTKHGHSLTYLPFIANAVCRALDDFPNLNSSVHGDSLILHPSVGLAIAVDLGAEGLVAPVIKNADRLGVAQLADAIAEIAQRARTGKLKPEDFSGGTYTLSNSGTFGTLITAPIINQPQVAILSTDGVRKKPVVVETSEGDSIAIRPVGVLAQSFDHRAVDGAYSAAFLDRVRKIIETSHWVVEV